jgi:hypothetical protein
MHLCIRDDDTSFFTDPDTLERAYGEMTKRGPVSLSVVPFCRAGLSAFVPESHRGRWSIHPLHTNDSLVRYLRESAAKRRFEIMLHGYHHDELDSGYEFSTGKDLARKLADGRKYLEDLLSTAVRVFVPPHNTIGRAGLRALAEQRMHLGSVAGVKSGWRLLAWPTWKTWFRLRSWRRQGNYSVPWVLDLGDHREIGASPLTPLSRFKNHERSLEEARAVHGVFCAATHYWELNAPSIHRGDPDVGEQLRVLIARAQAGPGLEWKSVGDILTNGMCSL